MKKLLLVLSLFLLAIQLLTATVSAQSTDSAFEAIKNQNKYSESELLQQGILYYDPNAVETKNTCGAPTTDPGSSQSIGNATYPSQLDPKWIPIWNEAGAKYGIDAPILATIFLVENRGHANKGPDSTSWPTSPAQAKGPFQIVPPTWLSLSKETGVKDIDDARDASLAAALYISRTGYKPGMEIGDVTAPIKKIATTVTEIMYKYNAGPAATASSPSVMFAESKNYVEIGVPIYKQITGTSSLPGAPADSPVCDTTAPDVATDIKGEGGAGGTPASNMLLAKSELTVPYGWNTGPEWDCLVMLWNGESGWDQYAQNPTSTAFGIAQFLNSTWAGQGGTKSSDARNQITLGLKYIKARYHTPCSANVFKLGHNYY